SSTIILQLRGCLITTQPAQIRFEFCEQRSVAQRSVIVAIDPVTTFAKLSRSEKAGRHLDAIASGIGTKMSLVWSEGVQHFQPVVKAVGIRHAEEEVDVLLEDKVIVILKGHHLIGARTQAQRLDFDVSVKQLGR